MLTPSFSSQLKYLQLDQKNKIMAEYVWIDAGGETRSKSRVGSLPARFPYLDPGPCFLAMQGNLAGKAPTCPAGPATAYRWGLAL